MFMMSELPQIEINLTETWLALLKLNDKLPNNMSHSPSLL